MRRITFKKILGLSVMALAHFIFWGAARDSLGAEAIQTTLPEIKFGSMLETSLKKLFRFCADELLHITPGATREVASAPRLSK